jgi:hypothetical protein
MPSPDAIESPITTIESGATGRSSGGVAESPPPPHPAASAANIAIASAFFTFRSTSIIDVLSLNA